MIACTQDGKITNFSVNFLTVHSIFQEKYIYRNSLMEVIIQDLITGQKSKIKVKKFIKKLAVYKDQVAALTKNKIYVYQLTEDDVIKTPKYSIKWESEANMLLLTSNHLIIANNNRIQLISLSTNNSLSEKEWSFEVDIEYLKVVGGPVKRESLLCGTKSGEVVLIHIDNQFPVNLYQHDIPIKSLDMACDRRKVKHLKS